MPKITLLGAGSGFTQPLFTDILNIDGLDVGVLALVDIDEKRLAINLKLMQRILPLLDKTRWRIEATTDRRRVLKGTDYLISTIEVSGVECVRHDNDIPFKYGIDQCIGDTIGPGGVMKALRTLPVFLEILEDAQRFCPQALIMNYTNPMSIVTLGAVRTTDQPFVGLCHSVQGNSRQIASILGVPYEELEWQCGGINHMSWFTRLRWKGRDLHAVLRAAAERPEVIEEFPIRADLLRHFGYFSTESCGHFSEYVPYYRKRKDLLKKHCGPDSLGGSGYRADTWPRLREDVDRHRRQMAEGKCAIPLQRSHEYAADIIEAHAFDRKRVIYASVPNTGLIPNLPQTGVVEVATLVDCRGFLPTYFGNLPEQCAALCRANMAVVELTVQGILNRDREAVIQAMTVDPLSAAVCSPAEIKAMAEELFAVEKACLPAWCAKKPKPPQVFVDRPLYSPFVRTLKMSRILPHVPLSELKCPAQPRGLGFKTRTFAGNFCNLHAELAAAGSALVYLVCEFRCADTMQLAACLGYDGPVKAWVDGKEVFHDPKGTNPARPDSARIVFRAAKGRHEFMVALDSNLGNAWGIFLRFERRDGSRRQRAKGPGAWTMPEIDGARFGGVEEVSSMAARHAAPTGPRRKNRT